MFDTLRHMFAAPFRAMNYDDYLRTEQWQRRRRAALRRAGNKCQVCGNVSRLQVHHNTYERLGHEAATDLVVLCAGCHRMYHDARRLKR